jgi:hypothetical protein
MASALREIADSVADSLETIAWSVSSTSVSRKNWANIDPTEMASPVVIVVPGGVEISRIGKNVWQSDYTVNVFIGRQVEADGDVDAMLDLANQAVEHLTAHKWPESVSWPDEVKSAQSVTIDINPDDAMNDRNSWRAVIAVVYRIASIPSVA